MGPFEVPWSDYTPALLEGLRRTVAYTVASFAGAAVLGLVLALLRISPMRILRIPAAVYTEVFKNVPLLAIVFLTYFGLASVGLGWACSRPAARASSSSTRPTCQRSSGRRSVASTADSGRRLRPLGSDASARSRT